MAVRPANLTAFVRSISGTDLNVALCMTVLPPEAMRQFIYYFYVHVNHYSEHFFTFSWLLKSPHELEPPHLPFRHSEKPRDAAARPGAGCATGRIAAAGFQGFRFRSGSRQKAGDLHLRPGGRLQLVGGDIVRIIGFRHRIEQRAEQEAVDDRVPGDAVLIGTGR